MTLKREIKQRIVDLANHTTKSQREIALDLGISRWAVQTTLRIWNETGSLEDHKDEVRHRPQKLSDREEKCVVRQSVKNPQMTAKEVQQSSCPAAKTVSVRTVQRILSKGGRKAYRPRKVPFLTKMKRQRRFEWAKQMENVETEFDEVSLDRVGHQNELC